MRPAAKQSIVSLSAARPMLRTFVWLFAALAMMALLSPPGATHDESYHASNIWCARGERAPYCVEESGERSSTPTIRTNITFENCQQDPDRLLWCPQFASTTLPADTKAHSSLFYFALSWLVVPSVEASVLGARVVNALVIVAMLAVMAGLLPNRHRMVLFLLVLGAFSPSGYFLFASINPSSWTALGIGVGWLAWYSAGIPNTDPINRKVRLVAVGSLAGVMAVGSRWDSAPFLALIAILVGARLIWERHPRKRKTLFFLTSVAVVVVFAALSRVVVRSPDRYLQAIVSYSDGEPDKITLFTRYLLQVLPNMLRALGSIPTTSVVVLPFLVYIGGLLVLAVLLVATYNPHSRAQQLGSAIIILAATVAITAQVANMDPLVFYGVEPHFIYPPLLLAVGWWFSLGPADLTKRLIPHLKWVVYIVTATFALSTFTIAERFVDRQAFGIRLIPDGPDQWWWSWMPVGPNVVALLSVLFMWKFLDLVRRSLIAGTQSAVEIHHPTMVDENREIEPSPIEHGPNAR